MSLHILLSGVLHKPAVPRTSQSGKEFVTANVRAEVDGAALWASVIAFDTNAQAELLRLNAGDSLSVQGRGKLGVFQGKDGASHPSLDVVADSVLPVKPQPRPKGDSGRPRAANPAQQGKADVADYQRLYGQAKDEPGFDDAIPF
jgi:single-stranded DNA-binding protein